jgi:hypothetical protein
MSAARTRHVAELFRRVAPAPLSRAALQSLLAISAVEGFGNWDGDMGGSNNFGGNQCTAGELAAGGGATYRCVPHVDHHADGRVYTTGFRFYIAGQGRSAEENGALDFQRCLSAPIRPRTGAVLARGGSLYELADAMHREHYFEGDARGGKDPVLGYAKALETRVTQIAAELGEAPAVSLHGSGGSSAPWLLLAFAAAAAWLLLRGG